jgi:alkylhydroperoxidase family enzyme
MLVYAEPRAAKRRLERVLGPTAPNLNEPPQLPRAGAARPLSRYRFSSTHPQAATEWVALTKAQGAGDD